MRHRTAIVAAATSLLRVVGPTATMAMAKRDAAAAAKGRLTARPQPSPMPEVSPGLRPLGLNPARDAYLHVPANLRPERSAPLVVAFHGAGGEGRQMLDILTGLPQGAGSPSPPPHPPRAPLA